MKRILWLTESWAFDTDEQIVPYLKRHSDFSLTWLVLGKEDKPNGIEYEYIKLPYSYGNIKLYIFFRKIFKQIRVKDYDLIYSSFHGFPFYYPALLKEKDKHTPVVHAAHNVDPYPVWPWKLRITVKFEFAVLTSFQMFSKHTARWFKEHYPSKSFFYAPMVVKDFGPVQTDTYKVDNNKVNLLFFGNVVANKRLDLLIDAVKELPDGIQQHVHLNICGKCRTGKEVFLHQIGDCKTISTYFKRIPDEEIPELFMKHQFFILPYQDVAQSGPHMIAYNYNLPVIASDISGFAERVEDGKNGFLFHVNDKQALMEAISKAVMMSSDDYQNMKAELKEFVDKNYSLQAVSQRYIDYFDSIL
ncbi:MAG TPA: hypothetical protein DCS83_05200 [Prevotella sp.]|nr:glycosyltransferase family 4 protein [uncultured Prevotella sp.]HAT61931.1 hypothetical protein [Prevotella sp.]